jgi:hypothetical protein
VSVREHPTSGQPRQLHLRERWQRVARVLDAWRYGGRWWLGEAPRDHYLLELTDGQVVEVYREGEAWVLARTAD